MKTRRNENKIHADNRHTVVGPTAHLSRAQDLALLAAGGGTHALLGRAHAHCLYAKNSQITTSAASDTATQLATTKA